MVWKVVVVGYALELPNKIYEGREIISTEDKDPFKKQKVNGWLSRFYAVSNYREDKMNKMICKILIKKIKIDFFVYIIRDYMVNQLNTYQRLIHFKIKIG